METQLKERIDKLVSHEKVFLFMKGNPSFPQCGFSNQVVQILKAYKIPFGHFDVLSDSEVRQGIKDYSDWPTIPQLFVGGEFMGGCDIVREAWENGELTEQLKETFPDLTIEAPKPPAQVVHISPSDAKQLLEEASSKMLDVRSPAERELASVDGFQLLDQELVQEMVDKWDRETPLVFMCHFGGRSTQAAEFFCQQGFQNVKNVAGGIDAWSKQVDNALPRY